VSGEESFQREVLGILRGYGERLANIEGAVGVRCTAHGREIEELKQSVNEDHEDRIRSLEDHRQYSKGQVAGISAAVGAGVAVVAEIVSKVWPR
jgi:hypothetical protein